MAAADYRLCDVCLSKCFYDAELQYSDPEENQEAEWASLPGHNTGAWLVICKACAKTHEIKLAARISTGETPDG